MLKTHPLLTLTLKGSAVESGSIAVDELAFVLKKMQLCVKRVGQVLSGEVSAAKPGRLRGPVESACMLRVVSWSPGSFVVGLALANEQEAEITLFGKKEPLGKLAIETLIIGLGSLAGSKPTVRDEFDYGVLASLREFGKVLDRGIDGVEMSYRGANAAPHRIMFGPDIRNRIAEHIASPIKSAIEIRGILREVDLERRTCQVYPSTGAFVDCTFEDKHALTMKEGLDLRVTVSGEAALKETDGRIKKLKIQDLEIVEDGPELDEHNLAEGSRPLTASALLKSTLVGLWKGRTDIGISQDFARTLRDRAQKRKRE